DAPDGAAGAAGGRGPVGGPWTDVATIGPVLWWAANSAAALAPPTAAASACRRACSAFGLVEPPPDADRLALHPTPPATAAIAAHASRAASRPGRGRGSAGRVMAVSLLQFRVT